MLTYKPLKVPRVSKTSQLMIKTLSLNLFATLTLLNRLIRSLHKGAVAMNSCWRTLKTLRVLLIASDSVAVLFASVGQLLKKHLKIKT